MNKRPMFSLVIPCYRPEKTIFRLFDSLTRQGISKDDLEVILPDDNSGNLDYREQLKTYGFELVFTETNVQVHCPGNTRQAGLAMAKGEWVFFADQDDFFEDNALHNVQTYIRTYPEKKMYVISTIMRSYDPITDQCYYDHVHKGAWLHGKWYSMDNLIKPYNITFKKDLYSHEDVYFNDCCLAVLFNLGTDWEYLNFPSYRWVDNPDSITRQPREDRGYLYENFSDYLEAAAGPYWMGAEDVKNYVFRNQVIMTLLHAYFYYECATYLYGAKDFGDILEIIRKFVYRMINELSMTPEYIVDFVYADAHKYDVVLNDCRIDLGFIPKTSFRDFIFRLTNVEK